MAFYERYGFKTLKRELEARPARGAPRQPRARRTARRRAGRCRREAIVKNYETVTTLDALDAWIAKVEAAPLTALDTETDSLDPIRARLIGISLSVAPGEAAYIPLRHGYAGAPDQLPLEAVLARLRPWLENPAAAKVGQNIKYDTHVFANAGIEVRGYRARHDAPELRARGAQAAQPGEPGVSPPRPHRPDLRGRVRQGREPDPVRAGRDRRAPPSIRAKTATWRCTCTRRSGRRSRPSPASPTSTAASRCRLAAILGRIERTGVLIDSALLAAQSQELAERMVALEHEAYELAGQPFNLGSPKQIGEILFGKLGLPVGARPRAARRRPTRTCCRSSPPTIRCRPSCSSTAACRS